MTPFETWLEDHSKNFDPMGDLPLTPHAAAQLAWIAATAAAEQAFYLTATENCRFALVQYDPADHSIHGEVLTNPDMTALARLLERIEVTTLARISLMREAHANDLMWATGGWGLRDEKILGEARKTLDEMLEQLRNPDAEASPRDAQQIVVEREWFAQLCQYIDPLDSWHVAVQGVNRAFLSAVSRRLLIFVTHP